MTRGGGGGGVDRAVHDTDAVVRSPSTRSLQSHAFWQADAAHPMGLAASSTSTSPSPILRRRQSPTREVWVQRTCEKRKLRLRSRASHDSERVHRSVRRSGRNGAGVRIAAVRRLISGDFDCAIGGVRTSRIERPPPSSRHGRTIDCDRRITRHHESLWSCTAELRRCWHGPAAVLGDSGVYESSTAARKGHFPSDESHLVVTSSAAPACASTPFRARIREYHSEIRISDLSSRRLTIGIGATCQSTFDFMVLTWSCMATQVLNLALPMSEDSMRTGGRRFLDRSSS